MVEETICDRMGTRKELFPALISAAILAPSAENTQPWRFRLDEEKLTVCLDTTRTLPSDIDHMLSLTALGACIENAVIAATQFALGGKVEYLGISSPIRSQATVLPIAHIEFVDGTRRDPLADYIESRCTCRRMDHRLRVADSLLSELGESRNHFPDVRVHWVDAARLREFANLVGLSNRMRFEHQPFHREIYDNLRLTAAEAERTRDGLDVAALQLPAGVASILSALRNWHRMKWANRLGFSRSVAWQAAHEVRRSGAVGFLTVAAPMPEQFVECGRALERMWLTASRMGLAFHPTAGLPVVLAHARAGCKQLMPPHQRLATDISEWFYRLFPDATGLVLQIAFRIGYGPLPPVRSMRRSVSEILDLT